MLNATTPFLSFFFILLLLVPISAYYPNNQKIICGWSISQSKPMLNKEKHVEFNAAVPVPQIACYTVNHMAHVVSQ